MMSQTEYPVGIELEKALANPGSDADVVLRTGDVLTIPQFSNTVKISGEVARENTVSYKKGRTLRYYINQAGGYSNRAKRSKAYVVYMNGTVAKANSYSSSIVQPGCEIVIPEKEDREGMTTAEILSLGSTAASLATVVLALTNLFARQS
jgi:protein involved in polysaccharide export with SLBB domain